MVPAFLRQSRLLPWPADMVTIRAVAAIQDSPEARERLGEAGLSHVDFPTEFARAMVREILDGQEMSPEVRAVFIRDHGTTHSWYGSLKMIRRLEIEDIMPRLDPVTAVDQFIAKHAEDQLSATLRWAADRHDAGELSCKDRRELDGVLDAAGVLI